MAEVPGTSYVPSSPRKVLVVIGTRREQLESEIEAELP